MAIYVIQSCDDVESEYDTVNQPGLYAMAWYSRNANLVYQSTYSYETCGKEAECCKFFMPEIIDCGLADECESY